MGTWLITPTDILGRPLAEPLLPESFRFTHSWNGPRTLETALPMVAPVAGLIEYGQTFIKAYRTPEDATQEERELYFHGTVWSQVEEYTQAGRMTILAADPWSNMGRAFVTKADTDDAGDVLYEAIETHETTAESIAGAGTVGCRIELDALQITPSVSVTVDWTQEAISTMARSLIEMQDGIDVELVPIEYDSGNIARLVVTPRSDTGSVTFRFESGVGTLNNCRLTRTLDLEDVKPRVGGYGDGGLTVFSTNLTMCNTYGFLESAVNFPDVTDATLLSQRTSYERFLGQDPPGDFTITPDGTARPYEDVSPGDIIGVRGVLGQRSFYAEARVLEMTTVVDAQGERIESIVAGVRRSPRSEVERVANARRILGETIRRSLA